MTKTMIAVAFLVAWCFAMPTGWAQTPEHKEDAQLAKALKDAKIPLERGLTASAKEASRSRRSTRWTRASSSSRSTR